LDSENVKGKKDILDSNISKGTEGRLKEKLLKKRKFVTPCFT
jgi:hypothetical protein